MGVTFLAVARLVDESTAFYDDHLPDMGGFIKAIPRALALASNNSNDVANVLGKLSFYSDRKVTHSTVQ